MYAYQPPPPFPVQSFPALIRDALIEIEIHTQAPLPLIGQSMLAAIAAVVQGSCKVLLPYGALTSCSLYSLVIADSGERKSAVDKLVCQPLREHDQALEYAYHERTCDYEFERELWKLQRHELKRQIVKAQRMGEDTRHLTERLSSFRHTEPSIPKITRFLLQDASERAILDALNGERQSVALMADEGGIILNSPALEKQGVLNKAWDGGPIKLSRSHQSVSAHDIRLTLSLMVQPVVLQEFLRKRKSVLRDSGFLARFLISYPASKQGQRFSTVIDPSWTKLGFVHDRMREILAATPTDSAPQDTILEFDEDAKATWRAFVDSIEVSIQHGQTYADIRDYASKSGEMAARIAGLFHFFTGQLGKITNDTLERAIAIVTFHAHEFQSIMSGNQLMPFGESDMLSLHQHLIRLSQEQNSLILRKNFVRQRSGLRKPGQFDSALAILQARGYLTQWHGTDQKCYIQLFVPAQNNFPALAQHQLH